MKQSKTVLQQPLAMQKAAFTSRRIVFFNGWQKRFGYTANFFVFPLDIKEHPNL